MTAADITGEFTETCKLTHCALTVNSVTAHTCTHIVADSCACFTACLYAEEAVVENLKIPETLFSELLAHNIVLIRVVDTCKTHKCEAYVVKCNTLLLNKSSKTAPDNCRSLIKRAFHILVVTAGSLYLVKSFLVFVKECVDGFCTAAVNAYVIHNLYSFLFDYSALSSLVSSFIS